MGGFTMKMLELVERVFDRLRPNVIIIAGAVTFLIHDFGDKLILELKAADVPPEVLLTALTGLIFTGIGGLIACMMRMFESPSVPADVFERMMRERKEQNRD